LLRKQIARLETRLTLLRKKAEDATVGAN